MHTSTPYSESTFGAEHGKGSQTGCVPDTTPSGSQENVCSVSPTPSAEPSAHLAVPVSPVRNCVSPQSLTTESSKLGTQEHTSATHVKFSGPKMCKRLSLNTHKKICGKSTELLCRDTLLTVQSSPTNLLEQFSLVPGVIHTPSSRARPKAP